MIDRISEFSNDPFGYEKQRRELDEYFKLQPYSDFIDFINEKIEKKEKITLIEIQYRFKGIAHLLKWLIDSELMEVTRRKEESEKIIEIEKDICLLKHEVASGRLK